MTSKLAVASWLQWSDQQEAEDRRSVLISDALSLESRLAGRIDEERAQVQSLAQVPPPVPHEEPGASHCSPASGRPLPQT